MKVGYLNSQNEQVDLSFIQSLKQYKQGFYEISLQIYQMATTLNRQSLSINQNLNNYSSKFNLGFLLSNGIKILVRELFLWLHHETAKH